MLAKSMVSKPIFGEVHKILFKKFKLNESRCVGFMLDGCAANFKALEVLTAHCHNTVGIQCMSHLANNAGEIIESRQMIILMERCTCFCINVPTPPLSGGL